MFLFWPTNNIEIIFERDATEVVRTIDQFVSGDILHRIYDIRSGTNAIIRYY